MHDVDTGEPDRRSGWFWDMIEGRTGPPPAPATLGFELISYDTRRGAIECSFGAPPSFADAQGGVYGGHLAAMLDSTLTFALLCALPGVHFAPTLAFEVRYLQPAPLGRLVGRGRVVGRSDTIAFLAGELYGEDGTVLVTATATSRIVEGAPSRPAASAR